MLTEEMATSSKQPKLTNELLIDLNSFDCLPDEVQLKIFKFLEIEGLMHCAQVSKRVRRICQDESIVKKVNLYRKARTTRFRWT